MRADPTTPPTWAARRRTLAAVVATVLLAGCSAATDAGTDGQVTTRPTATAPAATPPTEPSPGDPPPAQVAGTPTSQTVIAVPTQVALPSGALVPVDPADVDASGALVVPDDPSRTGWWTGGAQVGEPFGSVVIAGHIDSRAYGIGRLAELRDMAPGDLVTAGDGATTVTYRVESTEQIAKADLSADSALFDQTGPHRLVLITCDGVFDASTHRYADNLVVTAVAVS